MRRMFLGDNIVEKMRRVEMELREMAHACNDEKIIFDYKKLAKREEGLLESPSHFHLKKGYKSSMNSPNRRQRSSGRSNDEENDEDIEVLRKEYRNMQANRNAFAHESEMARITFTSYAHTFPYIQPLLTDLPSFHRYPISRCSEGSRQLSTNYEPRTRRSRPMWQGYKHVI